jgi:hypothetical protein
MPYKNKAVARARARERYATDPEFKRKSREATERWEAANPGKSYTPEYGRMMQLERRYGLTVEQYEEKLESQGGHCALCPAVQGTHKRRLTVDHDHKCCDKEKACGKCNRGILCADCNRKMGFLEALLRDLRNPENSLVDIRNALTNDSWTYRAMQYLRSYEVNLSTPWKTQENSACGCNTQAA